MYVIGKFDSEEGTFHSERNAPLDHGFDFYAPQSTLDEQGRRIVIGWMDMWETDMPTQKKDHWAGAMSLPRELVLDGERILFRPIEEIKAYRYNPFRLQASHLSKSTVTGHHGVLQGCVQVDIVSKMGDSLRRRRSAESIYDRRSVN
jgi:beta-fructofuranosidase